MNPNQLRIDRICVYKDEDNLTPRRATFIVEYKAPHKLTLPHLRVCLREMDIYAEVVNRVNKPNSTDTEALFQYTSDLLTTAAAVQIYHYMIESGLKYSYITTGQAFVFLMIDWKSPEILYFHLSEPGEEVQEHPESFNLCTAVSQVLAFTLLSFNSPVHAQGERHQAAATLKTWTVDYESILRSIPESERKQTPTSSGFEPRTYKHFDRSFYLLRKGMRPNPEKCRPESKRVNDMQSPALSGDESQTPKTPSRSILPNQTKTTKRPREGGSQRGSQSSSTGNQSRPYCTQRCLLGLVKGGSLDPNCPNVSTHRGPQNQDRQLHPINLDTWLHLLRGQLSETLDMNVEPLWVQGARGIMFKVTLAGYGYTVIAKGTVFAFLEDLQHEAAVYKRLHRIQGTCVPVFLGSVDLDHPYYYDFQVRVIHMIFLAWSGDRIDCNFLTEAERQRRNRELVRSVRAMHVQGVLHRDIRVPNVLWNAEVGRAMLIDFERADILDLPRASLQPTPPNLKRKKKKRPLRKGICQIPDSQDNTLKEVGEEEFAATVILCCDSALAVC